MTDLNNVETIKHDEEKEYYKYLNANEDDIRAAFLALAKADLRVCEAETARNIANRNKDAPLSVQDLGILGKQMNPQELQSHLMEIQKARLQRAIEAEEKLRLAQYEYRQFGIIVDGIKTITDHRRIGK